MQLLRPLRASSFATLVADMIHRFGIASLAVIAALALVSCSASRMVRDEMYSPLNAAQACCQSPREFKYSPLPMGTSTIEILTSDPVFVFETGRSFFKAFSLPTRDRALNIRITSFNNPTVGGFFQPDILLLDRTMNVAARIAAPLAQERPQRVGFFEVTISNVITVPADNDQFMYMVIRTTDDLLKSGISTVDTNIVPVGPFSVSFTQPGVLHNWPAGKLMLDITPVSQ